MTNCCHCSGVTPPPPPPSGACCSFDFEKASEGFSGTTDWQLKSCQNGVYQNDCDSRRFGLHFPNQDCSDVWPSECSGIVNRGYCCNGSVSGVEGVISVSGANYYPWFDHPGGIRLCGGNAGTEAVDRLFFHHGAAQCDRPYGQDRFSGKWMHTQERTYGTGGNAQTRVPYIINVDAIPQGSCSIGPGDSGVYFCLGPPALSDGNSSNATSKHEWEDRADWNTGVDYFNLVENCDDPVCGTDDTPPTTTTTTGPDTTGACCVPYGNNQHLCLEGYTETQCANYAPNTTWHANSGCVPSPCPESTTTTTTTTTTDDPDRGCCINQTGELECVDYFPPSLCEALGGRVLETSCSEAGEEPCVTTTTTQGSCSDDCFLTCVYIPATTSIDPSAPGGYTYSSESMVWLDAKGDRDTPICPGSDNGARHINDEGIWFLRKPYTPVNPVEGSCPCTSDIIGSYGTNIKIGMGCWDDAVFIGKPYRHPMEGEVIEGECGLEVTTTTTGDGCGVSCRLYCRSIDQAFGPYHDVWNGFSTVWTGASYWIDLPYACPEACECQITAGDGETYVQGDFCFTEIHGYDQPSEVTGTCNATTTCPPDDSACCGECYIECTLYEGEYLWLESAYPGGRPFDKEVHSNCLPENGCVCTAEINASYPLDPTASITVVKKGDSCQQHDESRIVRGTCSKEGDATTTTTTTTTTTAMPGACCSRNLPDGDWQCTDDVAANQCPPEGNIDTQYVHYPGKSCWNITCGATTTTTSDAEDPAGSCCHEEDGAGVCSETTESECDALGGTFVACDSPPCCATRFCSGGGGGGTTTTTSAPTTTSTTTTAESTTTTEDTGGGGLDDLGGGGGNGGGGYGFP